MTTLLILLTIIAVISAILMIYGFTSDKKGLGFSMLIVLVFTGMIGFGFAAPTSIAKKYTTIEKVKVIKIEHTYKDINVYTENNEVISFDKIIDLNKINDSTTFCVTKKYNHYHSLYETIYNYK